VLALASTALAWISFQGLPSHVSPDAQAAFFLAWTVPLGAVLTLRLYAPKVVTPGFAGPHRTPGALATVDPGALAGSQPAWPTPAQEMTVSSLGSPVSTS
jgi:hypothetical protein